MAPFSSIPSPVERCGPEDAHSARRDDCDAARPALPVREVVATSEVVQEELL